MYRNMTRPHRPYKSSYEKLIVEGLQRLERTDVPPVVVECFMRLRLATLDAMTPEDFLRETKAALLAADALSDKELIDFVESNGWSLDMVAWRFDHARGRVDAGGLLILGTFEVPAAPAPTTTTTPAVDTSAQTKTAATYGSRLAERFFQQRKKGRGGVEVHLSRSELAALCGLAFEEGMKAAAKGRK